VREVMGREGGADLTLPRERDAPEEESGALLGRAEPRSGRAARYAERSLASLTSAAIVSGKSAVIAAPTSRASSSGP
jgi:hypothetical protein